VRWERVPSRGRCTSHHAQRISHQCKQVHACVSSRSQPVQKRPCASSTPTPWRPPRARGASTSGHMKTAAGRAAPLAGRNRGAGAAAAQQEQAPQRGHAGITCKRSTTTWPQTAERRRLEVGCHVAWITPCTNSDTPALAPPKAPTQRGGCDVSPPGPGARGGGATMACPSRGAAAHTPHAHVRPHATHR
jgi:hypothetical protein